MTNSASQSFVQCTVYMTQKYSCAGWRNAPIFSVEIGNVAFSDTNMFAVDYIDSLDVVFGKEAGNAQIYEQDYNGSLERRYVVTATPENIQDAVKELCLEILDSINFYPYQPNIEVELSYYQDGELEGTIFEGMEKEISDRIYLEAVKKWHDKAKKNAIEYINELFD